ncbi:fam11a b protein [Anaeramoeba ignava]|uniref:Fam11a b protein n=1 Tax=Anaeramoeba ignava TaxID=1746090 RepID=A0A9Q0LMD4_ANAIG|nr:fam11a b protein [Anaeramoeba ignava]
MEKINFFELQRKKYFILELNHLENAKFGRFNEIPEKLKTPSNENNLIIEMLNEDILLYIFQFLSPGDLIRFGLTCKYINELTEDRNTWRIISLNYNYAFIWDSLQLNGNLTSPYFDSIRVIGSVKNYPKIEIENENENENQNLENETGLNQPLLSNDQEEFNIDSTKNERIHFINKLENPKQYLISKFGELNQKFQEKEKIIEKNKKRQKNFNRKQSIQAKLRQLLAQSILKCYWILIFIPLLIIFFIILILNVLSITKEFINSYTVFIFDFVLLILFVIFLGLKLDDKINWNYAIVFLPLFIFNVSPFLFFSHKFDELLNDSSGLFFGFLIVFGLIIDLPSTVFEIFLVCFLETPKFNHISYVFIPYYLLLFISGCFMCCSCLLSIRRKRRRYDNYSLY